MRCVAQLLAIGPLQDKSLTHHKEAESKSRDPLRLRLFWNTGNVPPFPLFGKPFF